MHLRVTNKRHLWYWVNYVFNRVDRSRVEAFGADRVAAEWILRLGGSVKFKGFDYWNFDYNRLPSSPLYLEAINADGLAITSNGLEHFDGLGHLQFLTLSRCTYLYDEGLPLLGHVRQTLLQLDLSYCTSLSAKGLIHLSSLKQLRELKVNGLKTTTTLVHQLQRSLPHCKIIT